MQDTDDIITRWQQLIADTREETSEITNSARMANAVDTQLLERILDYHLGQVQESAVVICKIFASHRQGQLNDKTLLGLAQWG